MNNIFSSMGDAFREAGTAENLFENIFSSPFFQNQQASSPTTPNTNNTSRTTSQRNEGETSSTQEQKKPDNYVLKYNVKNPSLKKFIREEEHAGARFESWSIKELKRYLSNHKVDILGMREKKELVEKCRENTWPLPKRVEDETHQCTICFDYEIDCVLVPCGHQWCSVCTFGMSTCPACKENIATRIKTYR